MAREAERDQVSLVVGTPVFERYKMVGFRSVGHEAGVADRMTRQDPFTRPPVGVRPRAEAARQG